MVVLVINTEDVMCIMVVAFLKAKQPPPQHTSTCHAGKYRNIWTDKNEKMHTHISSSPNTLAPAAVPSSGRCVQFALFYRSRGRASRLFSPFLKQISSFSSCLFSLCGVTNLPGSHVISHSLRALLTGSDAMRVSFSCLNSPVCSPFVSLLKKKTFRYVCVCVGVGADARRKRARKEREGVAENSGRNCHPGTRI
jgi:hypothetical protein